MKKLITLCLTLLIVGSVDAQVLLFGRKSTPTPAGVTCSGSATAGDTERFESGSGAFCLTGWTEVDTAAKLESYHSGTFVTGSRSMRVDLDNTADAFIHANPADDSFTVRFYLYVTNWVGGMGAGEVVDIFQIDNETGFLGTPLVGVNLRRSGTPACVIRLRTGATDTDGPTLTENTWYRVEVQCVRNATSTLRVYSLGGTQLGSDASATAVDAAFTYMCFGRQSADAGSAAIHIDNIKYDAAGTWPIGADE